MESDPIQLTKQAVPDLVHAWLDVVEETLFWPEENSVRLELKNRILDTDIRHKPRLENLEH